MSCECRDKPKITPGSRRGCGVCPCLLRAIFLELTSAVLGFRGLGDKLMEPRLLDFAVDWDKLLGTAARRAGVTPLSFSRTRAPKNGATGVPRAVVARIQSEAALLAIERGLYPISPYFGEALPEPVIFPPLGY